MQIETSQLTPPYGQIYRLTNKINGKMYHGQTTKENINDRWDDYKNLYCKRQPKLYNALKKYGWDNFLAEVIDNSPQNQSQLDEKETAYIRQFNSMNNGYNCNEGGSGKGHICEETRKNMSKAFTGRKLSIETKRKMSEARKGKNNPNYGKHHSIETKNKISKAKIGQQGLCGIANPMFGKTGNKNSMFGKHHTEESRRKISEARLGRKSPDLVNTHLKKIG